MINEARFKHALDAMRFEGALRKEYGERDLFLTILETIPRSFIVYFEIKDTRYPIHIPGDINDHEHVAIPRTEA
jgi:hypothetical protein